MDFCRTLSQIYKVLLPSHTVIEYSKSQSTLLSNSCFKFVENVIRSELHEHEPLAVLFCYKVNSLIRSSAMCKSMKVDRLLVNQYMIVLAEALYKATSYSEQASILVRTNCYPFFP